MTHDWILDVLADLKTFAQKNNLPVLAEQLDDTRLIAMAELTPQREGAYWAAANEPTLAELDRTAGSGGNA